MTKDFSDYDKHIFIDADLEGLIPGFLKNRYDDINNLNIYLVENDFKKIKETGHILKGLGGGYGFEEITIIGTELEKAAGEQDKKTIARLIEQLEFYLNNIKISFKHLN